jgi:hypothetical protein
LFRLSGSKNTLLLRSEKNLYYAKACGVKKPYGRLSGHGSSTEERGERSLESSRF